MTQIPVELPATCTGEKSVLPATVTRYDSTSPPNRLAAAIDRWGERGMSIAPLEYAYKDFKRGNNGKDDVLYLLEARLNGEPTVIGAASLKGETHYHRDNVTLDGIQTYPAPLYEAGKLPRDVTRTEQLHKPGLGRGLTWAVFLDTMRRSGYWHFPKLSIHSTPSAMPFYTNVFQKVPITQGASYLDMHFDRVGAITFLERVSRRKVFRELGLHKQIQALRREQELHGSKRKVQSRTRRSQASR